MRQDVWGEQPRQPKHSQLHTTVKRISGWTVDENTNSSSKSNLQKQNGHTFFCKQGERLLDEQGWREEAKGVIKEIVNFVKVFAVSDQLKASSTEIFLNLVTLEDSTFTIKLNERGFEVVGNNLDTNNVEGCVLNFWTS